jgi:thiamine-phosphate pyrophosphorylase
MDDVLQAGAPGLAMVRAIMNADNPTHAVQFCLAMLNRVSQAGSRL